MSDKRQHSQKLLEEEEEERRYSSLKKPAEFDETFRKCASEFIVTALFLYIINASGGDAIMICFIAWANCLVAGPVSGAHFNPSITIGLYLNKPDLFPDSMKLMISYILSQLAGGFFGIFLSHVVNGEVVVLTIPPGSSVVSALIAEFLFTGLFVFIVLVICTRDFTLPRGDFKWNPFLVGVALFTSIIFSARSSGGSLNPAVSICLKVYNLFYVGPQEAQVQYLWAYLAGEVGGSFLAYYVYNALKKHTQFLVKKEDQAQLIRDTRESF